MSFYFLLALLVLSTKITAKESESFVIRRAYLDVLGVVPTVNELEWYLVYNDNGYEKAVDWLLSRQDGDAEYTKEYLMSIEYRNSERRKLEKNQVYKNLFYAAGCKFEINPENIKIASLKFINNAILSRDGETEIIDYMCESLMGRISNLTENNILSKIIKNSTKSEMDTWVDVLNAILEFGDVNSK